MIGACGLQWVKHVRIGLWAITKSLIERLPRPVFSFPDIKDDRGAGIAKRSSLALNLVVAL